MSDPEPPAWDAVKPWLAIGWPYNVVELVSARAAVRSGVDQVVCRPLLETDPTRTVSIFADDWTPDEKSAETGPGYGPTLSQYKYRMQVLVRDGDQVNGHKDHGILSKSLRSMLADDTTLDVAFGSLTETMDNRVERFQRRGVSQQKFFSNEINRSFVFLSTLDFWVQVEKS